MKHSIRSFVCLMAFIALLPVGARAAEGNEIYTIKVNDLVYAVPEKKHSAGEVIGTVFSALAGEASNSQNQHYAPAVSSAVRSALSSVRRLAPVSDGAEARFDLNGDITSIVTHTTARTVEHKDSKGKTYNEVINHYEASIAVTLTITDTSDGQQWTNSFTGNTLWYASAASESNAFDIALSHLGDEIEKAYNGMFPLRAQIVEPGDVKKDKQKDVYIDLGEGAGVRKGLHFEVFELSSVAGHETRKRLGKLKVEETLGDDISRCKVEKGAKEIKSAIDEGKTLLVTSID